MGADLWRQIGFFDPVFLENDKIHVIGAGALGSHFVDTLASMGIQNLVVYDDDTVENHNLPNQIYRLQDVGKPKVEALKQYVKEKMGYDIEARNERVEKIENLSGYLCLCVDSMQVRKDIILNNARLNPRVKMVVESRMGISQGQVFNFDPNNRLHLKKWMDKWYSDEDALESPCNSKSIAVTAKLIASIAAARIVIYARQQAGRDNENTVLYNESVAHICGNIDNYCWDD